MGKRSCTEDCSRAAFAPRTAEGCPATVSPATLHPGKGEACLPEITLMPCLHLQPYSMVAATPCALPWESHQRLLSHTKNCLAHPGSSSPLRDAHCHHGWRYRMWHGHLQGSLWWWGKQQGPHLASLVSW